MAKETEEAKIYQGFSGFKIGHSFQRLLVYKSRTRDLWSEPTQRRLVEGASILGNTEYSSDSPGTPWTRLREVKLNICMIYIWRSNF